MSVSTNFSIWGYETKLIKNSCFALKFCIPYTKSFSFNFFFFFFLQENICQPPSFSTKKFWSAYMKFVKNRNIFHDSGLFNEIIRISINIFLRIGQMWQLSESFHRMRTECSFWSPFRNVQIDDRIQQGEGEFSGLTPPPPLAGNKICYHRTGKSLIARVTKKSRLKV